MSVDSVSVAKFQAIGKTVNPPVRVTAMIDTGSDVTCILPRTAGQLGLIPSRISAVPVYGVGSTQGTWHAVGLNLLTNPPLVLDPWRVLAISLAPALRVDALIGRDVLAQRIFTYDGQSPQWTLKW